MHRMKRLQKKESLIKLGFLPNLTTTGMIVFYSKFSDVEILSVHLQGAGVKMEHFQTALDPRKQELLEARFLGARDSTNKVKTP
nr:unnamed protein product [Callosobruchus chinensis]